MPTSASFLQHNQLNSFIQRFWYTSLQFIKRYLGSVHQSVSHFDFYAFLRCFIIYVVKHILEYQGFSHDIFGSWDLLRMDGLSNSDFIRKFYGTWFPPILLIDHHEKFSHWRCLVMKHPIFIYEKVGKNHNNIYFLERTTNRMEFSNLLSIALTSINP